MKTTIDLDLDVDAPERVGEALEAMASACEAAAECYEESVGELNSAWGDPNAGAVWGPLAARMRGAAGLLRKQARHCEAAVSKYV